MRGVLLSNVINHQRDIFKCARVWAYSHIWIIIYVVRSIRARKICPQNWKWTLCAVYIRRRATLPLLIGTEYLYTSIYSCIWTYIEKRRFYLWSKENYKQIFSKLYVRRVASSLHRMGGGQRSFACTMYIYSRVV